MNRDEVGKDFKICSNRRNILELETQNHHVKDCEHKDKARKDSLEVLVFHSRTHMRRVNRATHNSG